MTEKTYQDGYEQGYADAKKEFETPTGNWKDWKCSECDHLTLQTNFKFCPWCGTRMEGSLDESRS